MAARSPRCSLLTYPSGRPAKQRITPYQIRGTVDIHETTIGQRGQRRLIGEFASARCEPRRRRRLTPPESPTNSPDEPDAYRRGERKRRLYRTSEKRSQVAWKRGRRIRCL